MADPNPTTAGPWHVVAEDGTDFTAIATTEKIDGVMDLQREVLGSSEWLRVKPADLRLMAAAPDLLDALKGLLDFIEIDRLPMEKDALFLARRAIAKAEGREQTP